MSTPLSFLEENMNYYYYSSAVVVSRSHIDAIHACFFVFFVDLNKHIQCGKLNKKIKSYMC
jgi:hypothetical protein